VSTSPTRPPDQPDRGRDIRVTKKFGQFDVSEYDERGRQVVSLDNFETLAAAQAAYPRAEL